jgi:protein SCO1/2
MRAVLLAVGLLMLVSGCTQPAQQSPGYVSADPEGYLGGTSLPQPYTMPDVSLTDTAGRPYNLATSPSRPVTLMFFGYSKCPDVCITVLSDLALALQRLDAAQRDHIQVIFVTTDPARDKRPSSGSTSTASTDLRRLTGPMATIKRAAGEVG